MSDDRPNYTHSGVEEMLEGELSFPLHYASGEGVDSEDFTPSYYRVEGPNGPVSWMNKTGGMHPTTMYDFAVESTASTLYEREESETPWGDVDDERIAEHFDQHTEDGGMSGES